MKFTATIDVEMSDQTAAQLIKKGGVKLEGSDRQLAMLMVAMTHLYREMREFLMTPSHTPIDTDIPALFTAPKSPIAVHLTITPEEKDPCTTKAPSSSTSKTKTPPPSKKSTRPSRRLTSRK